MTALLETPVGALDVSTLEQRQPDVPLLCTRGTGDDEELPDPCTKTALWEALCSGCGHVFRRCEEHYGEQVKILAAVRFFGLDEEYGIPDGQVHLCADCEAPVFLQQYVRIGA